jgi:hypothetical protein
LQVHEGPFMYKERCPLQKLAGTWGAFYVQGALPSPKTCRYMRSLLCARSVALSKDLQVHEGPFMCKECWPFQRLAGTWGAFYVQGALPFPKTCRYMRGLLCARSVDLSKDLQVHEGPFMCKECCPFQRFAGTWWAFYVQGALTSPNTFMYMRGFCMCKERWPLQRLACTWGTFYVQGALTSPKRAFNMVHVEAFFNPYQECISYPSKLNQVTITSTQHS